MLCYCTIYNGFCMGLQHGGMALMHHDAVRKSGGADMGSPVDGGIGG